MKEGNQKIAINTAFLYIRMFVIMIVSLYTSRVILQKIGVEDFGIYNAVGSIVVLFSFFNIALSNSTQRFLSYEIGKNDITSVCKVFSISLSSYVIFSFILLLILEPIGYWFINNKMNLPLERINAAYWCFQFSLFTFCVNMIRVPYNSSIIAYEKMNFYAIISIVEAILKLLIVYLLTIQKFYDKLILYAFLLFAVNIIINICYKLYCNKYIKTTKYKLLWDKAIFKKLFSFSGWSMFGITTNIAAQQGLSVLFNLFWGVVLNAALGIANQVNGAINQFMSNFQVAYSPQLVKLYAKNDFDSLFKLIFRASKFSFILLFIPAYLLILNIDPILSLWLENVPQYTSQLCSIIIICTIIDSISVPFNKAILATGEIKNYQIFIGISFALDLLCSYILICFGCPPYIVLSSRILTRGIINMLIGMYFLKKLVRFPIKLYLKRILLPISTYILINVLLYFILHNTDVNNSFWIINACTLIISVILSFFYLLDKSERFFILSLITKKH